MYITLNKIFKVHSILRNIGQIKNASRLGFSNKGRKRGHFIFQDVRDLKFNEFWSYSRVRFFEHVQLHFISFSKSSKFEFFLFRCSNSLMWCFRWTQKLVFFIIFIKQNVEAASNKEVGVDAKRLFWLGIIMIWTSSMTNLIHITCCSFWKLMCA